MGLLGTGAIGAAIGGAASIFGGMASAKAMKNVKANLQQQQNENEAWYNRRYNEDATQRADAQRILTITADNIRERNKQAAAAAAVGGGTDESLAAARQANNEALADAASKIDVSGEARKDNIENTYLANKSSLNSQLNDLERQKAQNISQAVSGVASAAGDLGF
jgi:glycosidase